MFSKDITDSATDDPEKPHFSNFKIPSYIFKAKQPTIALENDAISAIEPKNFSIKPEGVTRWIENQGRESTTKIWGVINHGRVGKQNLLRLRAPAFCHLLYYSQAILPFTSVIPCRMMRRDEGDL